MQTTVSGFQNLAHVELKMTNCIDLVLFSVWRYLFIFLFVGTVGLLCYIVPTKMILEYVCTKTKVYLMIVMGVVY